MSDYRVRISVKNDRILSAIEKAGYENVNRFCVANDISPTVVGRFVNLAESPLNNDYELKPSAKKICDALSVLPDDLWSSDQIRPLERNYTDLKMSSEQVAELIDSDGDKAPSLDAGIFEKEKREKLQDIMLMVLTSQERQVLEMRSGIGEREELTLTECGDVLGVTRERVRQIERKAFRKLSHPKNALLLRELIGDIE